MFETINAMCIETYARLPDGQDHEQLASRSHNSLKFYRSFLIALRIERIAVSPQSYMFHNVEAGEGGDAVVLKWKVQDATRECVEIPQP
jgi:hypothetical protein